MRPPHEFRLTQGSMGQWVENGAMLVQGSPVTRIHAKACQLASEPHVWGGSLSLEVRSSGDQGMDIPSDELSRTRAHLRMGHVGCSRKLTGRMRYIPERHGQASQVARPRNLAAELSI